MDEYLCVMWARQMWEAMNPLGISWEALAMNEIKGRMKRQAGELLSTMGVTDCFTITLAEFRRTWGETTQPSLHMENVKANPTVDGEG